MKRPPDKRRNHSSPKGENKPNALPQDKRSPQAETNVKGVHPPQDDVGVYEKVFGAPPPPFGTGRMSKQEQEINASLVKRGFNPLPMRNYDVGESPSEVARRLKADSSAKHETPHQVEH